MAILAQVGVVALALAAGGEEATVVVRAAEVRAQAAADGQSQMRILFAPDPRAPPLTYLGLGEIHPGGEIPRHRHPRRSEILYVLGGSGTLTLEERVYPIQSGDAVRIPAGREHSLCNTGDEPLVLLQTFFPPRPERRFKQGDPPPERDQEELER